jgi:hypothetical protein
MEADRKQKYNMFTIQVDRNSMIMEHERSTLGFGCVTIHNRILLSIIKNKLTYMHKMSSLTERSQEAYDTTNPASKLCLYQKKIMRSGRIDCSMNSTRNTGTVKQITQNDIQYTKDKRGKNLVARS